MRGSFRSLSTLALCAAILSGCVAKPETYLVDTVYRGDLGEARAYWKAELGDTTLSAGEKADLSGLPRNYLLNHVRLALLNLCDGYAPEFGSPFETIFEILRTQGINDDKTVASVVLNEDLNIWKGEPFEQALSFFYTAVHYGTQGDWENARAAMLNAVFPLANYAGGEDNVAPERVVGELSAGQTEEQYFGSYLLEETNFTLGYLMTAIASQQVAEAMGDVDVMEEARDNYRKVVQLNPGLRDVVSTLEAGDYNTVLVVDYGRGPQKIAVGPDQVIATFRAHTPSTNSHLVTFVGGRQTDFLQVCDVNAMALDHVWNNREQMRKAKSQIGTAMVQVGATTAILAGSRHANTGSKGSGVAALVGLGILLIGIFLKTTAYADTRYCELMPQRIYVAPVKIERTLTTVELQVWGSPGSTLVLTGLNPPAQDGVAQLRYVRLVSSQPVPPVWATSGVVNYFNDQTPVTDPSVLVNLPYILGGHCVRQPTEEVLLEYQAAGFLADMTLSELEGLYRLEGIRMDYRDVGGVPGLHILEGGDTLISPPAGTVGFTRLHGVEHGPYQARTEEVRALQERWSPSVEDSPP